MTKISSSAVIHRNVILGNDVIIEDFCIIGIPVDEIDEPTIISDGAHIRAGTYIYAGVRVGKKFITGNRVNIRHHCVFGNCVSIGTNCIFEHSVKIGDGVRFHSGCFVPEFTQVGDKCWIGPNVTFTNARIPNQPDTKENLEPVNVGANTTIGAGVLILPGRKIGNNCFLGAGSLINNNIEDGVLGYGNPFQVVNTNN
jgi:acetyltransferase-like isoleucine patch superfamily enzyme